MEVFIEKFCRRYNLSETDVKALTEQMQEVRFRKKEAIVIEGERNSNPDVEACMKQPIGSQLFNLRLKKISPSEMIPQKILHPYLFPMHQVYKIRSRFETSTSQFVKVVILPNDCVAKSEKPEPTNGELRSLLIFGCSLLFHSPY